MKLEEQLLDWIENKDFDELTLVEQEKVFSVMSEQEYQAQRSLVAGAARVFEQEREFIVPDLASHHALKQQLSKKETKVIPIYARSFPVKFYQVAAAALLFGFVWWQSGNNGVELKPQIIEKEKLIVETRIDTVFQEKLVEVPIVQIKEVIEYIEAPKENTDLNLQFITDDLPLPIEQKELPNITNLEQEIGNSPFSNDELSQFRRGI